MKELLSKYQNRKFFAGAFSFVELQVALVMLAVGLLSFAGLFRIYSRQISYIEKYSEPNMYIKDPNDEFKEYWIVSHTNEWMRQLGAPADMNQTLQPSCWRPPVYDDNNYNVQLMSLSPDFNNGQAIVEVNLVELEEVNE